MWGSRRQLDVVELTKYASKQIVKYTFVHTVYQLRSPAPLQLKNQLTTVDHTPIASQSSPAC
jgi:hypothetical protein